MFNSEIFGVWWSGGWGLDVVGLGRVWLGTERQKNGPVVEFSSCHSGFQSLSINVNKKGSGKHHFGAKRTDHDRYC